MKLADEINLTDGGKAMLFTDENDYFVLLLPGIEDSQQLSREDLGAIATMIFAWT